MRGWARGALAVSRPLPPFTRKGEARRGVLVVARLGREDELEAFRPQTEIAAAHHAWCAACRPPAGAARRHRRLTSKRPAMQLNGTPVSPPPSRRCVSPGQLASWLARPQALGDGDLDRAAGRIERIARVAAAAAQAQVDDRAHGIAQADVEAPARSRDRRATRGSPRPSASPGRYGRSDRRRGRSPPSRRRPWRRRGRENASRPRSA